MEISGEEEGERGRGERRGRWDKRGLRERVRGEGDRKRKLPSKVVAEQTQRLEKSKEWSKGRREESGEGHERGAETRDEAQTREKEEEIGYDSRRYSKAGPASGANSTTCGSVPWYTRVFSLWK
jgi:hypothetical protein